MHCTLHCQTRTQTSSPSEILTIATHMTARGEQHNCIQFHLVIPGPVEYFQCAIPLKAAPAGTDSSTHGHCSLGQGKCWLGLEQQVKSNLPLKASEAGIKQPASRRRIHVHTYSSVYYVLCLLALVLGFWSPKFRVLPTASAGSLGHALTTGCALILGAFANTNYINCRICRDRMV